jgi:GT2 family glycosyltransferase
VAKQCLLALQRASHEITNKKPAMSQKQKEDAIPDLSIVIVSWNVRELLKDCLRSLRNSIDGLTFEVFVVDNASSDGSADMVRKESPDVRLIANSDNVGFGRANNQALKMCQGRYVLFLNPDTLVPEGSVEKMVRFLDRHPDVGMVGPELIDGKDRLLFNWSRLSFRGVAEFVVECLASTLSRARPVILFDQPYAVKWLTGACWLVRRDVIDETGPFDENLFMYGEEPDFCHRVRKADWKIHFLRHVRIVHYKGQSAKQVGSSLPRFLVSMIYVMRKRLGLSEVASRRRVYDLR